MHDILTPSIHSGCSKFSPIFPYRPGPLIGKTFGRPATKKKFP